MIMKKGTFKSSLLVLSLLIIGCSDEDTTTNDETTTTSDEWSLVFEEEFEDDLSNWNIWEGGAFNEEIQLYREEQLSIEDGLLKIDIQRENVTGATTPFNNTNKSFEYVSGRIESKELYAPTFVDGEREYRFIASIKLPSGAGFWPAFWTYGDPWPTKGEIDIIEARGNEPLQYISNLFYGENEGVNENVNTAKTHLVNVNTTSSFNTYEMVWKANTIQIYFNDELVHTYIANTDNNVANMFGKEQKIVLNTAVGGWFIPDDNSDNYADSGEMQVDWVRVYKR